MIRSTAIFPQRECARSLVGTARLCAADNMAKNRMESSQALRKVLSFTLKHWQSRKWLAGGIALTMSLATLAEIMVPTYAGRLIDALAHGPSAAPAAADA